MSLLRWRGRSAPAEDLAEDAHVAAGATAVREALVVAPRAHGRRHFDVVPAVRVLWVRLGIGHLIKTAGAKTVIRVWTRLEGA